MFSEDTLGPLHEHLAERLANLASSMVCMIAHQICEFAFDFVIRRTRRGWAIAYCGEGLRGEDAEAFG